MHQAANSDSTGYGALVGLFECVETLLRGLYILRMDRTETPPTTVITKAGNKIMTELLSVLSLATKQVNEGRLSMSNPFQHTSRLSFPSGNYAKKFLEGIDVRVILQRLTRLTQEEVRETAGLILEVIYGLVNNMTVVLEGECRQFSNLRQYR